ncbi:unnamed protein product [Tetraodon nigroviridis]|uniref:(spotted green pufferfish) hypothetical protein n=1 Tax=Tetraodon nigroviridis TaxID=99883 RepID=Q4SAV3_TETNG|nr:unnamed protein product [Tetraodon nigroviridis]
MDARRWSGSGALTDRLADCLCLPPEAEPGPGSLPGCSPGSAEPAEDAPRSRDEGAEQFWHDTCQGYYDVSGQFDKEFSCNNTDHRFCCGSCFLRFCCADRGKRLEQKSCTNYNTPDWVKTQPPSPGPTGESYDPELDRTNATVYISCGLVALVVAIGISAKVAYDRATKAPQEMNVHRALADILRQQGPAPVSQYEHEDLAAMDGSPKDETPVRASKNHYTPVHSKAPNHGHYGMAGGQDLHNFLSSGFLTLGRGPLKAQRSFDESGQMSWQADMDIPLTYGSCDVIGRFSYWVVQTGGVRGHQGHLLVLSSRYCSPKVGTMAPFGCHGYTGAPKVRNQGTGNHHHDYQHSHLDLSALTPKLAALHPSAANAVGSHLRQGDRGPPAWPRGGVACRIRLNARRMNNILTSSTEPYDLSLSRSFQNLSHLPPSYELALKSDSCKSSSSCRRGDGEMDEFYPRKHHLQAPPHLAKLSAEPQHRQRPRRVQRAMSQDHVLSPPRTPRRGDYGLSSYGAAAANAYGSSRHLSDEQLLSVERLHSQDPLLSPAMRRDKFREKAMARAMSHADMLLPVTPVRDRHKLAKMHSQVGGDSYNTLTVNQQASSSKRQAFASRRTHTVDHLQYVSGHHHAYRTASKNEVTV